MSLKWGVVKYPKKDPGRMTPRSKLVLVGDSSVGKSSIAVRLTSDMFLQDQERTIGTAFFQRSLLVKGGIVKLDIWDTAGEEKFRSLGPLYYSEAQAAIVVFDVTKRETFDQALSWVNDIRRESPKAVVALAGNKSDISDGRMVFSEEAEEFAKENNLLFMEASAKTGLNVDELFLAIAEKLSVKSPKEHPEKNPKKQELCTTGSDVDLRSHVRPVPKLVIFSL